MLFIVLLKVFVILQIHVSIAIPACNISINKDFGEPQPLLIKTDRSKIVFPTPTAGSDNIPFSKNEAIEVYCPGGTVIINGVSTNSNSSYGKCTSGGKFSMENNEVSTAFISVNCSKQPKSTARFTGNICFKKYKKFEIGFRYKSVFLNLITGCFDSTKLSTIYTKSTVLKNVAGHQLAYPRPSWVQGSFYNIVDVNSLYSKVKQRLLINNFVGLNDSITKYISTSEGRYLSRGHLSPKVDFLFGSQQRATFYLINAIPQWQTINRGNWNALESNIRNLASTRGLDLDIYTGTYGILSYPHELSVKEIKLYLYKNGKTKKVPVPKYIWKIIYHLKSKKGVAFVSVNNPYIEDLEEYTICKNICDKLSYLTWSAGNIKNGYIYCCEVDDLRKNVDVIPDFEVEDLLV